MQTYESYETKQDDNYTGELILFIIMIIVIVIILFGTLYHIWNGYIPSMQRHELTSAQFIKKGSTPISNFLSSVNQQSWWHICLVFSLLPSSLYFLITIALGDNEKLSYSYVNKILGKFLLLLFLIWLVLWKFASHITYHHLYPQYLLTNNYRFTRLKNKFAKAT